MRCKPTGLKIDNYLEKYKEIRYNYDFGDDWQLTIIVLFCKLNQHENVGIAWGVNMNHNIIACYIPASKEALKTISSSIVWAFFWQARIKQWVANLLTSLGYYLVVAVIEVIAELLKSGLVKPALASLYKLACKR